MDHLTDTGRSALEAAASRHGFSQDAARAMLDALVAGGGSQAQFSHPEFGGMGQWSRGGMIMIGDMFNNGLKYRVDALANDLSGIATDSGSFAQAPRGSARGGSDWWPDGLGSPSSVGAQNDMRYAVFPGSRRLAVDRGGRVTVYDTGDHNIGGASQQQGGGQNLSFSSQYGTVTLDSLSVVEGDGGSTQPQQQSQPQGWSNQSQSSGSGQWQGQGGQWQDQAPVYAPDPAPRAEEPAFEPEVRPQAAPQGGQAGGDPLALLERLAELRDKGVLSDEEFAAKKAEILSRL
jgi:hypothetical protein